MTGGTGQPLDRFTVAQASLSTGSRWPRPASRPVHGLTFSHLLSPSLTSALLPLLLGLVACDSADKAAVQVPPLTVRVTQSTVQDVPLSVEMVGTTMGTQDVPIRTRVEGYLETMEFEEGTFVKKGDMLYTILRTSFFSIIEVFP